MSDPGVAAKSPTRVLKQKDLAGEKLFAEYAKIEEADLSEKDRLFQEIEEALTLPPEIEERLFTPGVWEAWGEEAEDVANGAAKDHFIVSTVLEEMAGLETEYDQFQATTRVLRENLDEAKDTD